MTEQDLMTKIAAIITDMRHCKGSAKRLRIDADAVAYHNGAWTSKPLSSRSPSLE